MFECDRCDRNVPVTTLSMLKHSSGVYERVFLCDSCLAAVVG